MSTFRIFMLKEAYENVRKNGDKLAEVETLIDRDAFRPIIAPTYHNNSPMGGRPNLSMSRRGHQQLSSLLKRMRLNEGEVWRALKGRPSKA